MVRDIAAGNLSPTAIDLMTASISVPIPKGDDQVRPLAIPEILYKISALLLLESVDHLMGRLFPKASRMVRKRPSTALRLRSNVVGLDPIPLC